MRGTSAAPVWLGILVLAACGGDSMEPTRLSVSVSPATVQRLVGVSFSLRATVKDAGGNTLPGRAVTWTTSNTAVATVVSTHTGTDSTAALVKGVGSGTATIAATAEGQSGSAAINVVPPTLAFTTNRDGNDEIYVVDAAGTDVLNLSHNAANDDWPSWSPDGSKIAFHSDRDGNWEIYVMNADGSGVTRLTNTQDTAWSFGPVWSPDGSRIAFVRSSPTSNGEIYVMNADGSSAVRLTTGGGY